MFLMSCGVYLCHMIFLVEVLCIKKPVKETIHGLVLLFYPHRQFLSLHKFYIFQFSYLIVMTNTKIWTFNATNIWSSGEKKKLNCLFLYLFDYLFQLLILHLILIILIGQTKVGGIYAYCYLTMFDVFKLNNDNPFFGR